MAKKACEGLIRIGPTPVDLGEIRSWSMSDEGEELDVSVMGSCQTTKIAGRRTQQYEINYYVESADPGQLLLTPGSEGVALELYPRGNVSGRDQFDATVNIISNNMSADVDGAIEGTVVLADDGSGFTKSTIP